MSNDQITIKLDKKKVTIGVIILLLLLLVICLFSSGTLSGRFFNKGETDKSETNQEQETDGTGLVSEEEEDESGQPAQPFVFDAGTLFEGPSYFNNTMFPGPVPATLLTTSRPSENVVMYTFQVPEALQDVKYTANIALPTGGTSNYECEVLEEYPDRVYCYGGLITTGVEVTATLYVSDANYSLGNVISPGLLDASAEGLGIDWGPYNTAASNMGMGLKVNNPFEAWNVIGCCVMNSEGDLPAGCESLPVGNNNVPDFFGVDQVGNEGAADAIWNNILQDSLAPTDWEPEYDGKKIDEEALLAKANACAAEMGAGNLSSIGDAREFYNLVRRFDTRVDYDRSWGADLADSITDFWDDNFGFLFDPEWWSNWADYDWGGVAGKLSDSFGYIFGSIGNWFTDAGRQMACGGIYAAKVFTDFETPSWCLDDNGDPIPAPEPETAAAENYEPEDLIKPLPDSCLDYIDYANKETYFFSANTIFAGNYTAQYCMDALNVDPGISTSVAITQPDALYDALIENYEYVGNPAMPDACKAFTDWCNSDQLRLMEGGYTTGPVLEGASFMAVNGCNDPDNWQEKHTWSANQDPPDCSGILNAIDSGQSGALGIYDAIRDAYESGSPYVTNTHCYQVWSERENFNNTPAGQVKSCAEAIKYNKPLETVADYMDFLTFMGALGGLYQEDYAANYPGCQTALDWAYWMGLDRQGINAAGTSCDEGGPTQATQPLIFINPQTFYSQPSGGGNGGGNGGGAPACQPDLTPCNTCGISSCVIQDCVCVAVN